MKLASFDFLLAAFAVASPSLAGSPAAKPLSAARLADLFGGKTWQWSDGGGYFGMDRVFIGTTRSGGTVSHAAGRWRVTNKGLLCLRAAWRAGAAAPVSSTTCFEHVERGGDIYQRKVGGGDWYVFKHAPTKTDDEFNKLVPGNRLPADQ